MKKDKKNNAHSKEPQTGMEVKKNMPIKNAMTDGIKNTVSQTPGLNQAKTTRDDLLPSDGDNMTT